MKYEFFDQNPFSWRFRRVLNDRKKILEKNKLVSVFWVCEVQKVVSVWLSQFIWNFVTFQEFIFEMFYADFVNPQDLLYQQSGHNFSLKSLYLELLGTLRCTINRKIQFFPEYLIFSSLQLCVVYTNKSINICQWCPWHKFSKNMFRSQNKIYNS